jgi:hypothetical protein
MRVPAAAAWRLALARWLGFNRGMHRAPANNRNTNNAVPLRVDDQARCS